MKTIETKDRVSIITKRNSIILIFIFEEELPAVKKIVYLRFGIWSGRLFIKIKCLLSGILEYTLQ